MRATLDRIVNAPANLPWDQQLELARSAQRQGEALTGPPRPVARTASVSDPGARYMDWLNDERRKARDEQFRLRCR